MEIRSIAADKLEYAGDLLARAFQNDPVSRYMFADDHKRPEIQRWIYTRWAGLMAGLGGAFMTAGGEGVSLCIPPAYGPEIPLRYQIQAGLITAPFKIGWPNFRRAFAAFRDVSRRHGEELREPHWILDVLGVDPAHQGKGVGGVLLEHLFSLADRDRAPCYVITHNINNVPFYEHHGFERINILYTLPGGPPTCSLRRPCR